LRLFPIYHDTFATFAASICKQSKPQTTKATQTKLIQNALATLLLLSHKKKLEFSSKSKPNYYLLPILAFFLTPITKRKPK
jgi:hypothetical protein